MLPELTRKIFENWYNLFPGVRKPTTIRYLGIPGSVEGGTTSFLAFTEFVSRPLFAVKIHRYSNAQKIFLNERDILSYLQTLEEIPINSVPRLILCDRIAGVWVLVQSILDGQPMTAAITNEGTPELKSAAVNINIAANWLAQLYRATWGNSKELCGLLLQEGLKTIENFSDTFDLSTAEKQYLKMMSDELNAITNFGIVVKHGDYCRQNIMLCYGSGMPKVGVIDWTDSRRSGFPLHDLFFFLTTYFLQVRKHIGMEGFIKAFEDTFFSSNSYSNLVKLCLKDYCKQVQIDISIAKTLFGIFLVEQAMFEYKKLTRSLKHGGMPRFTIYLAALDNKNYTEALKEQLWIYFFRKFIREQKSFIL